MSYFDELPRLSTVLISQKFEAGEIFGFETRNKYEIQNEQGVIIGFAAEQQKGFFGFLLRQFLGHWRSFEIHVFDELRIPRLLAKHPFRIFFQRLEVFTPDGKQLGSIQQRFSILTKKFDVEDLNGLPLFSIKSPLWKIWTFPVMHHGRQVAEIQKKWSGLFSEAFTDKDKFKIQFMDPNMGLEEKLLLLVAGVFVDLQYFESKAQR